MSYEKNQTWMSPVTLIAMVGAVAASVAILDSCVEESRHKVTTNEGVDRQPNITNRDPGILVGERIGEVIFHRLSK